MGKNIFFVLIILLLFAGSIIAEVNETALSIEDAAKQKILKNKNLMKLTLQDCFDIAFQNNQIRPASQYAVQIAQAQQKQALSSNWPQFINRISFMRTRDNINVGLMGFEIDLLSKNILQTGIFYNYSFYTGGKRSAIIKQANAGIKIAKQEFRRTDLEVIYNVKKMYYGVVFANNVQKTGRDAFKRLEIIREISERLYKAGSGSVTKADYLKNTLIVKWVGSMVVVLESNVKLAKAALKNMIGLTWDTRIKISEKKIPFEPHQGDLSLLISDTYVFNPDWMKFKAGLEAVEAGVEDAKSGRIPKAAIFGSVKYFDSSQSGALMTDDNKHMWTVGVGVEVPLFDGFLTKNKIREAKLRLAKVKREKILLKEGLALQIQHIFFQMQRAAKQHDFIIDALETARDNRELNDRAFQNDMVELEDVINAQIMENFLQAYYQKILYDYIEAQAHLEYAVAKEVVARFKQ